MSDVGENLDKSTPELRVCVHLLLYFAGGSNVQVTVSPGAAVKERPVDSN